MKYLDEISDRKSNHVVIGGGVNSTSQPLITITYLAYIGAEGRSHGRASADERARHQYDGMGAGQESNGDSKDHKQLVTQIPSWFCRHGTPSPLPPRGARSNTRQWFVCKLGEEERDLCFTPCVTVISYHHAQTSYH